MKKNKQLFLPNWGDAVGRGVIVLTILLFAATLTFAQGTLKENGKTIATIPQYELSGSDTEWIINVNQLYSYKWSVFFEFESITGTKDGTLTVYVSADNGNSWVLYPSMSVATISANGSYSFDDSYTIYDQIKIVFTANSITGGTVNINQRLISNPKK